MTADMDSQKQRSLLWKNFWIIAAALTALRVITLMLTPLGIGPDEAQYWHWSRDLDVGYYSKPPLIAWAIALTTGVFGNADWAVRLSAPFFHFGAAAFLYLTTRRLYDDRTAFWVGLGWLLMPGVLLSSFIMATDAPLLFFWSAGLYFLVRIMDAQIPRPTDFIALGGAIGLGLMAKYAMIYFPLAMGLSLISKPVREKLFSPALLLTVFFAAAIFIPNIFWNATHDFQTLSHTAANANWGADLFKPLNLAKFLAGQFAVFGVIFFAAFVFFISQKPHWRHDRQDFLLLVFSLTPLTVVMMQSFLSRAHANWAAAAYPAAMILVTGWLIRQNRTPLLKLNAGLHALLLVIFTTAVLNPGLIDNTGFSSPARDLRGWKEQTDEIMSYAPGYDAVLMDDRYLMGEMLYHQQNTEIELAALDPNAAIDNHYEAFQHFDPSRMKRVLFVTLRDDAAHVDYRFHDIKKLGVVEASPGAGQQRRYTLYGLSGYFGPEDGIYRRAN